MDHINEPACKSGLFFVQNSLFFAVLGSVRAKKPSKNCYCFPLLPAPTFASSIAQSPPDDTIPKPM
jgi:hypothetical protein